MRVLAGYSFNPNLLGGRAAGCLTQKLRLRLNVATPAGEQHIWNSIQVFASTYPLLILELRGLRRSGGESRAQLGLGIKSSKASKSKVGFPGKPALQTGPGVQRTKITVLSLISEQARGSAMRLTHTRATRARAWPPGC